jgi:preprotein translocase subunit SecE
VTPDRRLLAGLVALAVVATGCGSTIILQATYPPTPQPTAPGGQPTSGPVQPGSQPTPAASGFGNETTPGGAPVLEKQLPDQVGTEIFSKVSFNGATQGLAGAPFTATKLDPFLKDSGKSLKDVTWAIGRGTTGSTVMAVEVAAVDATQTMDALGPGSDQLRDATMGNKTVKRGGATGFWVVLYPKGDILFWVQSPDATQLDAIVAALP